jgi:predicted ester cyclase
VTHPDTPEVTTSPRSEADDIKAVFRRNTEQVQGQGDFALFEELFADNFVDHTPQPGTTPDKAGVLVLYKRLRDAFPDFRPEIHWQTVDGDIVTTYKVYHGTHHGDFLGIAPTGKTIQFETVDAMRVRDGRITDHWGVANGVASQTRGASRTASTFDSALHPARTARSGRPTLSGTYPKPGSPPRIVRTATET